MAVVRLGTCSWADEGLVKTWYPKGVSSAAARLGYYAERFDAVEVDSPFYRLPSPETSARWAERTPDGFVFHAKASKAMTGHEEAELETAFRDFREALEPLEAAGKLRGVLMQYPPRFKKSPEALAELEPLGALLDLGCGCGRVAQLTHGADGGYLNRALPPWIEQPKQGGARHRPFALPEQLDRGQPLLGRRPIAERQLAGPNHLNGQPLARQACLWGVG